MNWLELVNQLFMQVNVNVVGIAKRRVLDNNGLLAGQGCLTSLIKKMDVRLMRLFFLSPTCCWLPRPHINHIMIFIHFCHNISSSSARQWSEISGDLLRAAFCKAAITFDNQHVGKLKVLYLMKWKCEMSAGLNWFFHFNILFSIQSQSLFTCLLEFKKT